MRNLSSACMKSAKKCRNCRAPAERSHRVRHTGARSANTTPPRGHSRGLDDPSDPHESAHHSGIGHRCRDRACGGLLPPCGRASCTALSTRRAPARAPHTPHRNEEAAPRATAARPARTVRCARPPCARRHEHRAAQQHASGSPPSAPCWAARRAPARLQGSCEQRARPREGAAAAGWRLRFEFAPVGEGPDGRRGRLGRARVRKRRCAGTVVAPARPTAAKVRRAHAAIARVPRHRLAAARVAPVCSKREKEITSAPLIAARGRALDARCGLECCHHDARWRKRGRGGRAVCAIGVRPGGPIACICRRTGHEVEELCSLARFDASDHRPETWGGRAVGRVLRYRWVQSRWRQASPDSSRYVDQRLGLRLKSLGGQVVGKGIMRTKSPACERTSPEEIMRANGHAGRGGEASPKGDVTALRPAALRARRGPIEGRSLAASSGKRGGGPCS